MLHPGVRRNLCDGDNKTIVPGCANGMGKGASGMEGATVVQRNNIIYTGMKYSYW
jgi:hypothetical protein